MSISGQWSVPRLMFQLLLTWILVSPSRMSASSCPMPRRTPILIVPKPFCRPRDISFNEGHAVLPFTLLWPPKTQLGFTVLVPVDVRRTLASCLNNEVGLEDIHCRPIQASSNDEQALVQWRVLGRRDFKAISKLFSLQTAQPRTGQFKAFEFESRQLQRSLRPILAHESRTEKVVRARLYDDRRSARGEEGGASCIARRFLPFQ